MTAPQTLADLERGFRQQGYVAERPLMTAVFLQLRLGRPLLLEGHAGVGKTETAKVLAATLDADLIRLQCYEGLDVNAAVYEWNYQRQLLAMKAQEHSDADAQALERHIFGREFLLERPLLRAISHEHAPAVLLIDEVDRADEEFEAFLLEMLSDFQITIPEIGTVRARHRPHVILTSNRVRELSDALKRRCLYHWIDYPDAAKELEILRIKVPELGEPLGRQVVALVQTLRRLRLEKPPGVAETLDWALSLLALGQQTVDAAMLEATRGCLLKSAADFEQLTCNLDQVLTAATG
ncbi:MAG: MoxR family ATPase [Candidatus Lambdaproteobacteria bacterium]|nr:MoxR family ATPase [Candidatus Lambdaproteobacteria bacterium]